MEPLAEEGAALKAFVDTNWGLPDPALPLPAAL